MKESYWHNFKTGVIDCREAPHTDEEALQYISQNPSAQSMYLCYRQLGASVLDAMIKVLSACIG